MGDGKLFNFLSKKAERSFLMKRNPRKISWTVLYRKKHKKGTQEEVTKKRTRRNVKFQRSIQGATLDFIMQKRNMKPEVREAQRTQAVKAAKEKAKAKKSCEECWEEWAWSCWRKKINIYLNRFLFEY